VSSVYLSATHKSSGKTTLSIGLTRALVDRGLDVQPFKKGPDYIDPLWLTSASGRPCYNLDFFTQSHDEISALYAKHAQKSDMALIEGNVALFDGLDMEGRDSNAALAKHLDVPVLLIVNTRGMTRSIAPLLLGYQAFDQELNIAGVILNQVGGSRHQEKLIRAVEYYTELNVIGAVDYDPSLGIDERHLGLIPSNESDESETLIRRLANRVRETLDLDRILEVARQASPPPLIEENLSGAGRHAGLRIGYPQDRAFGFYYPDDLDRMRHLGVELVPFDTITDACLPKIDGLFMGGGFPETAMQALQANSALLRDVAGFVESGGPVYAECGGLIYLSRSLIWGENKCRMAGVIPGDIVMYDRPQGRGYVRLQETGNSPWPASDSTDESKVIKAHEFHYSALTNMDFGQARFAYRVLRGTGIDGEHDGYVYKNLLASYTHRRGIGPNGWVDRFLALADACKRGTE
jgi:cobyrinic acid a,c-diamide synthase